MKIFILFLLPFVSLFAQNYKVEYEGKSLLSEQEKKRLAAYPDIIEQYEAPKTYDLFVNENNLCLSKERPKLNSNNMEMIGSYTINYTIINPVEKIIYEDINIENRNYKVKSPLKLDENWVFSRDTKTINGIISTKETMEKSKNTYEVWFEKNIKTKCGPNNFGGLPGLVLEITIKPKNETGSTPIVKMTNIETINNDKEFNSYFNNISDKTISRGEFDKIYEDYQKKVQEMYGGNGVDKD